MEIKVEKGVKEYIRKDGKITRSYAANKIPEELINWDKPHEYRKKYGESPCGNIHKIIARMSEEERKEFYARRRAKIVESCRKAKKLKEEMNEMLGKDISLSESTLKELKEFIGKEKPSVQKALIAALMKKALEGDVQAFVAIRDTSGQKPKDEVEQTVRIDDILKNNGIFEEEE